MICYITKFASPGALRPSLERMGIETKAVVNVGGFSSGQKAFLDFDRKSVLLKAAHITASHRVPGVILPVVSPCPFCSIPPDRIWIESEHAIAFAADAPAAEGHILVVPKEHVPSIHGLPMAAQKGVWALVSDVRGRLRTGLVPDAGFSIGFVDGLTAGVPVSHTVIHVIPRRAGENVELPECGEWIRDDGVLA